MLESTFREDLDEIGSNRVKKGHLLLKSTIFFSLLGVNGLITLKTPLQNLGQHAVVGRSNFSLVREEGVVKPREFYLKRVSSQ